MFRRLYLQKNVVATNVRLLSSLSGHSPAFVLANNLAGEIVVNIV